MVGDRDDWAVARDAAAYFGADASELPAPPKADDDGPAGNVSVECRGTKIDIPERDFRKVFSASLGGRGPFDGVLDDGGLSALAAEAKRAGFADWAGKLEQFRAGMGGRAYVRRDDGNLWTMYTPPVVRTVSPADNSITKRNTIRPPTTQDYMAEKNKAYNEADRDATRADVLDYFARLTDDNG